MRDVGHSVLQFQTKFEQTDRSVGQQSCYRTSSKPVKLEVSIPVLGAGALSFSDSKLISRLAAIASEGNATLPHPNVVKYVHGRNPLSKPRAFDFAQPL